MIPGLSTAKLIGFGLGALALIAAVLWFRSVLNERAELREWRDDVVVATRAASANPKLAESQVPLQIQLLGKSIAECKGALERQNAAVENLAKQTEAAQIMAAEASRKAAQRVKGIEGVINRLNASARSSKPQDACKPSETLAEQWR